MSRNSIENSSEDVWQITGRHLIAGVALYSPNLDPSAIPIPEEFTFLYSLPQHPLCALSKENSKCALCFNSFQTDIPQGDEDIFEELHGEVPLVMSPCCGQLVGSHCLKRWLDPFRGQNNCCVFCRHKFFTKLESQETEEGQRQFRRIVDWHVQETRRRITEGPEEWKEDAIHELELWEDARGKLTEFFAKLGARRELENRRLAAAIMSDEEIQFNRAYDALTDLQRNIEELDLTQQPDDLRQSIDTITDEIYTVAQYFGRTRGFQPSSQSEAEETRPAIEETDSDDMDDVIARLQQAAIRLRNLAESPTEESENLPVEETEEGYEEDDRSKTDENTNANNENMNT